MNERIRELAAAARHYTNDTVLHLERVHNRDYSFEEINEILDAKFAELIVRECMDIAKNREDELESAGLISESNAVGNVSYRISRQFGVKR